MSGSGRPPPPPADDPDDDGARDAWEPGLRRRRRGRSSTGSSGADNGTDAPRENLQETNNGSDRDGATRSGGAGGPMRATPGPATSNGDFSAGIGAGPACGGGGGGGVGVLTSPAAALGGVGVGGAPPSTPYKTPTKEAGLVAATPSSLTTSGETADSTLLSNSPLRVRRQRSGRGGARGAPSLRRQYQLLRSQIILLLGSAVLGLILFLFYALPLAAFVSFVLMMSSMGALVPVARSTIRARYEMEMEHPLGLTRYLPDSLRIMLTETSLHEFMTDPTFYMENRYLLLYFMPGLQPEQLMDFINQLPPRHREILMQPGLGQMMPAIMENLMRMDNSNNGGMANPLPIENGDDASTASGLTHHGEGDEEDDGEDAEVTLLDAVAGIGRTLAGVVVENRGGGGDEAPVALGAPMAPPVAMQGPAPIANAPPANGENSEQVEEIDDNSSFDFSIDARSLTNMLGDEDAEEAPAPAETPANNTQMQNVIVELPPQPEPDRTDEPNAEVQQQEYDLEGRILSQAASAAAANYAAQAASAARDGASEVVATTSSWFIRAGALTGFIAGGGGMMVAFLANNPGTTPPLLVTLGAMSGMRSNGGGAISPPDRAANGNASGTTSGQEHANSATQWVQGLFAASAFGFASAGFAYLLRNRARANIAARREEQLKDAPEKEDSGDADNVDKP